MNPPSSLTSAFRDETATGKWMAEPHELSLLSHPADAALRLRLRWSCPVPLSGSLGSSLPMAGEEFIAGHDGEGRQPLGAPLAQLGVGRVNGSNPLLRSGPHDSRTWPRFGQDQDRR